MRKLWESDGFELWMGYSHEDQDGRSMWSYILYDIDKIVRFQGNGYSPCPMCPAIKEDNWLGDSGVMTLLMILTLTPGEAQPEFFQNYSPQEMEYLKSDQFARLKTCVNESLAQFKEQMEARARDE